MLKKTPFELRYIELNDTVGDVIGFVADVAKGRGVVLNYAPVTAELFVRGDPIHLQQVVLNLIVNALDAMSEIQAGKRDISVTTNVSGAWAEIRIADTGGGIAMDDLNSIFNPFFTTKPQGMGMVFGTPVDITLSELALETFFPADERTAERLKQMAAAMS